MVNMTPMKDKTHLNASKSHPSNDLVVSREIDAPLDQVWEAWTNPKLVSDWWGPKNFSTPVSQIDFREGGSYFLCMQSPEGQKFYSTGVYQTIVPKQRIVATDSFADEKGNVVPATFYGMAKEFPLEAKIETLFEEHDGKTRLILRHEGIPGGKYRKDAEQSWNESLDKLEKKLNKQKNKM